MSYGCVEHPLRAGLHSVEGAQAVEVRRLVLGAELEAAAHAALLLRGVRASVNGDARDVEDELRVDGVRVPLAVRPRGLAGVALPLAGERLPNCSHDAAHRRDGLRSYLGEVAGEPVDLG